MHKTSLLIGRWLDRICHNGSRAMKLRQSGSRRNVSSAFLQFICDQLSLHKLLPYIMSLSTPSTNMFRRTLLSSRLVSPECSARSIRPAFVCYRKVSSAARLPTITASETRRRPTVRPYQQPASQGGVNGLSPTSKRTIFIQTENTPNPDVSSRVRLYFPQEQELNRLFFGSIRP